MQMQYGRPVDRAVLLIVGLLVGLAAFGSTASGSSPRYRINSVVSGYLSHLIDRPSSAHDRTLATRTKLGLTRAAIGTPEGCLRTIRAINRRIMDLRSSAQRKRRQILDAAAPVPYRC
jgi:hypothetical protein